MAAPPPPPPGPLRLAVDLPAFAALSASERLPHIARSERTVRLNAGGHSTAVRAAALARVYRELNILELVFDGFLTAHTSPPPPPPPRPVGSKRARCSAAATPEPPPPPPQGRAARAGFEDAVRRAAAELDEVDAAVDRIAAWFEKRAGGWAGMVRALQS